MKTLWFLLSSVRWRVAPLIGRRQLCDKRLGRHCGATGNRLEGWRLDVEDDVKDWVIDGWDEDEVFQGGWVSGTRTRTRFCAQGRGGVSGTRTRRCFRDEDEAVW
ncbi:hypothetical protein Droror1_Dr00019478 [Drosera rotundifolia]